MPAGYLTNSRSPSRTRVGSQTDLLPRVNGSVPVSSRSHIWLTRRYTKLVVVATLTALGLCFSVILRWRHLPASSDPQPLEVSVVDPEHDRLPPDWARFREYELQTSAQHGDSPDTKYFFIADHARSGSVSSQWTQLAMLLPPTTDGAYMQPFDFYKFLCWRSFLYNVGL